jgi:hypothetical protein
VTRSVGRRRGNCRSWRSRDHIGGGRIGDAFVEGIGSGCLRGRAILGKSSPRTDRERKQARGGRRCQDDKGRPPR